ncbi:hypothetical protein [Serinicoccus profundi]|nr:hypothetical protein [Serinicoccus profundi]
MNRTPNVLATELTFAYYHKSHIWPILRDPGGKFLLVERAV